LLWAVAASIVLAVGATTLIGIRELPTSGKTGDRFATEIGEQRRVVLPDGSGVQLNTDSEIRVRMEDALRVVTLVKGEAIFDVEKDPARPFQVVSGTAVVDAIGTRFNVYLQQARTVVTVVDGRVTVSPVAEAPPQPRRLHPDEPNPTAPSRPAPTTENPVELDAGQTVAVATNGTVSEPVPADVERATSWTRRRLIFDADTLYAVVAEFNRYNRERLVIADPVLSDRRITGVFNLDDPEAFLALLSDLEDIHIEEASEGWREIHRAVDSRS
jgi:transmembrane sensor